MIERSARFRSPVANVHFLGGPIGRILTRPHDSSTVTIAHLLELRLVRKNCRDNDFRHVIRQNVVGAGFVVSVTVLSLITQVLKLK
jgi:hypothetical protein